MPRRAREKRVLEVALPDDGDDTDSEEPIAPEVEASDALVSDVIGREGGGPRETARIFRRHPRYGTEEAFLDEIPTSSFSRAMIRDQYGGGHYRVEFYGAVKGRKGRATRGKKGTEQVFSVDLAIPPKAPVAYQEPPTLVPDVGGPFRDRMAPVLENGVLQLLTLQQETMRALGETFRAPPRVGLSEVIEKLTPVLTVLLPLLFERRGPDDLERLKTTVELLRDTQAPAANPLTQVEQTKQLIELVKGMLPGGPEGDREPSALGLARDLGVPLLQMLRERMATPGAGRVGHERLGSGFDPGSAAHELQGRETPVPLSVTSEEANAMRFLEPYLNRIEEWAREQRTPEWAADGLLHGLDAMFPVILPYLERPDLVDRLTAARPALAPYRFWLMALQTELLGVIRGDDDDDDSADNTNAASATDGDGPGPGRGRDVAGNGSAGPVAGAAPRRAAGRGPNRREHGEPPA